MFSIVTKWRAAQQESQKLVELVRAGLPVNSQERINNGRPLNAKSAAVVRQLACHAASFAREHQAGVLWRS